MHEHGWVTVILCRSLTPQRGRGFCWTETTQAPYNVPAGVRMTIRLKISHDVKIVAHVFFISF